MNIYVYLCLEQSTEIGTKSLLMVFYLWYKHVFYSYIVYEIFSFNLYLILRLLLHALVLGTWCRAGFRNSTSSTYLAYFIPCPILLHNLR